MLTVDLRRNSFILSLVPLYIYISYIHPELRIWNYRFRWGAAREQGGALREQEGALWGSAGAQQVGA